MGEPRPTYTLRLSDEERRRLLIALDHARDYYTEYAENHPDMGEYADERIEFLNDISAELDRQKYR